MTKTIKHTTKKLLSVIQNICYKKYKLSKNNMRTKYNLTYINIKNILYMLISLKLNFISYKIEKSICLD